MIRFLIPGFILLLLAACTASHLDRSGEASAILPAATASEARYLIYLHGKLIEDQGLPAVSAEHGEYRYGAILDRFASLGFTVLSETRSRNADVTAHAKRAVAQIDSLIEIGVRPENITVVGASKGAYIAALTSHLTRRPQLNFVLLAGCHPRTVAYMRDHGVDLYGRVLAIRDVADTEFAGSCEEVFSFSEAIGESEEIVLNVGTGHGILYQPLDEWVLPTSEWANGSD